MNLRPVLLLIPLLVCTDALAADASIDDNLTISVSDIRFQQQNRSRSVWAVLEHGGKDGGADLYDVTSFGVNKTFRQTAPVFSTLSGGDLTLRIPQLQDPNGDNSWMELTYAPDQEHGLRFRVRNQGAAEVPEAAPAAGNGQTYYVSTSGNDADDGSMDSPWKSIQFAADQAGPGDTVYVREGVYEEGVTLNKSGSEEDGYLRIMNYPGEAPVIDGGNLAVPEANTGLFLIVGQHHILISGFEIRNYRADQADAVPVGIQVRGGSHHIYLYGNRIHGIAAFPGSESNAHGIAVYGDSSNSIHQLHIYHNELHDLELGASEALVVNGNVEDFTISRNSIHDVNNIAIDIIGFEGVSPEASLDQARSGTVRGNIIAGVSSFGNPAYGEDYSAGGIYVDGGADITIEGNTVSYSDIGIEIASEHQGKSTSRVMVRNNMIFSNRLAGLSMGGYDELRGSTADCEITNNTFYLNDSLQNGNGEITLQFDVRDNLIYNNIFYGGDQGLFIANEFTENQNNVIDSNIYFNLAGEDASEWQWKGMTYAGFSLYRSETGNDANSLFTDPLFVNRNIPDLHLKKTSPALDAGMNIPGFGYDYDGQTSSNENALDIGADQHQSPL